jgi:hypothetical protein
MVNSLGDDSLGNNNSHTLKDLGNFIRGMKGSRNYSVARILEREQTYST